MILLPTGTGGPIYHRFADVCDCIGGYGPDNKMDCELSEAAECQ